MQAAPTGSGFRAPRELVALADDARACGNNIWDIHMDAAVAAFVAVNGPPEVVAYNWNKARGCKIDPIYVERVAVVSSAAGEYDKHDLGDTHGNPPASLSLEQREELKQRVNGWENEAVRRGAFVRSMDAIFPGSVSLCDHPASQ